MFPYPKKALMISVITQVALKKTKKACLLRSLICSLSLYIYLFIIITIFHHIYIIILLIDINTQSIKLNIRSFKKAEYIVAP